MPTGYTAPIYEGDEITFPEFAMRCPHGVRRVSATAKTCWHPGAARLAIAPRLNATASSFILAA